MTHSGRIGFHPRFRHATVSSQLRQSGSEHSAPPGEYHPQNVVSPISPPGYSFNGPRVYSQNHHGSTGSHPRFVNALIYLQLRQPRDDNRDTWRRHRLSRRKHRSPIGRSLISWGAYMEPALPGEYRAQPSVDKSFHICSTLSTPG